MIQTPPFLFTSFFSQLALSLTYIPLGWWVTQSSGSYVTEAGYTIQQSWHITAKLTGELLSQNGSNEGSVFMPGMAPWFYMVKLCFHMISTKLFILFTLLYFFSWVCLTLLWVTQEYQWYLTSFSQSNNKIIQQVRTDGKELFAHYLFNSRGFTSRI